MEKAKTRRAELSGLCRWSEADEAVLVALRDALSIENVVDADLGGLVYVAGGSHVMKLRVRDERSQISTARLYAAGAMLLVNRGREPQTVVKLVQRALESLDWHDMGTLWYLVLSLIYADDLQAARELIDQATTRGSWLGSRAHAAALTLLRARLLSISGEPHAAWQSIDGLLRQDLDQQFGELAVAWAVAALVDLDRFDRAEDLLISRRLDGILEGTEGHVELLAARGALRAAEGRPRLAYEDFSSCGRELAAWGVTNPAVAPWRSEAALCAAATGRHSLAYSLGNEELFRAQNWGTPQTIGAALRAFAYLSERGTDVELFKESVEHLSGSRLRLMLVRAQYELGIKLLFRARPEEGWAALKAAKTEALSIRSVAWAHRVDEAVRRWGQAPMRAELTSQEVRVANLTQAGFSNKESSVRLKLSVSTVEFHLSNIYQKLAISGRNELRSLRIPIW
ncbi:helix-turn-helix transcriptional regulator [Amycolatopsis orientalis]|uniref:helix-turn-helix transcriptional regulator n=1 Tax=Amycolatopsis orientalis TaxID=31958 RepID=UPI0011AB650B|nr:helix-turn-helix transcriptional regulator [Amycolatopsis orientalis]